MAFRNFVESADFGERAQRWADALYFGPPGWERPIPFGVAFGISGVGLIKLYGKDYIALLAPLEKGAEEYPLIEAPVSAPQSDPNIYEAIQIALPNELPDQVCVLRIPRMARSAAAGVVIYGAMQGRAGPRVTWASTRVGFITAGHVAAGAGYVTDATGRVVFGRTVHAFDPATPSGGSAPNVDVALIEPPSGSAVSHFAKGSVVPGLSAIDLHLATPPRASTILGMISWYVWPGLGTYVDLFMTNAACTVPGDSGAAVTNAGTSDLIGIVVGGTRTFSSFIQDIDRQIAALRTVTGLGALSL